MSAEVGGHIDHTGFLWTIVSEGGISLARAGTHLDAAQLVTSAMKGNVLKPRSSLFPKIHCGAEAPEPVYWTRAMGISYQARHRRDCLHCRERWESPICTEDDHCLCSSQGCLSPSDSAFCWSRELQKTLCSLSARP